MEAQLKEAERKAADAQKLTATVDKRGSSAEKKVADAEQRSLQAERTTWPRPTRGDRPRRTWATLRTDTPRSKRSGTWGSTEWETTGLPREPEPTVEPEEEGLSLRERLARAAAGCERLS